MSARLLIVAMALAAGAGCSIKDGRVEGPKWLTNLLSGSKDRDIALAFDTEDADSRRAGILALSGRRGGLEEPYLKAYALLAEDPDPLVRSAAILALGRAGEATYRPTIVAGLEDSSPIVRADAAVSLDRMPGLEAVDPLSQHAVDDADPEVRVRCIRALRHYRRRSVLQTLILCVDREQLAQRRIAREVLREMTGEDFGYDSRLWDKRLSAKEDPFAAPPPPSPPWWRVDRLLFGPATRPAS